VPRSEDDLKQLASRVKFDLESAGFTPRPDDFAGPEGGVSAWIDQGRVVVGWNSHDRLGDAAEDMREISRELEPVVQRHRAVQATMHVALVTMLTAFGYRVTTEVFGSGIHVDEAETDP
jgi:hypothetical protein